MADKVEVIGVVGEITKRHRVFDSNYRTCSFVLKDGTNIFCDGFIPIIRVGWNVRVIGEWTNDTLNASEVERFDNRKISSSKEKQNKLFGDKNG